MRDKGGAGTREARLPVGVRKRPEAMRPTEGPSKGSRESMSESSRQSSKEGTRERTTVHRVLRRFLAWQGLGFLRRRLWVECGGGRLMTTNRKVSKVSTKGRRPATFLKLVGVGEGWLVGANAGDGEEDYRIGGEGTSR